MSDGKPDNANTFSLIIYLRYWTLKVYSHCVLPEILEYPAPLEFKMFKFGLGH